MAVPVDRKVTKISTLQIDQTTILANRCTNVANSTYMHWPEYIRNHALCQKTESAADLEEVAIVICKCIYPFHIYTYSNKCMVGQRVKSTFIILDVNYKKFRRSYPFPIKGQQNIFNLSKDLGKLITGNQTAFSPITTLRDNTRTSLDLFSLTVGPTTTG